MGQTGNRHLNWDDYDTLVKKIEFVEEQIRDLEIELSGNDLEFETKAFKIQTLIFPKSKWSGIDAVKKWARSHGFKTSKVDTTSTSWRLRQRDPGKFKTFATICINPSRKTPMNQCRVKAVGGEMK